MVRITRRGRELASYLAPFIGSDDAVLQTCSLVARHAATHERLQVIDCNDGLTDRQRSHESRIEDRIRELVRSLPPMLKGKKTIGVEFGGDPRGFTVKLVVPGDKGGNTWGLDGRYGI